jgi:hypothetical protein
MNHENRAHAKLSASGSKQWLNCTPSIRLSEGFPDTTSPDAELGTKAHELADNRLQWFLDKKTKLIDADEEMIEYVGRYTSYVMERYHAALAETLDAVLMIEQRLDFSEWVPFGFGTGDAVIVSDGVLEIIDLKYGIGVPVSARNNSQLMLYALGAVNAYYAVYGFHTVKMTIIQPRLDSITTHDLLVTDLLRWANEIAMPKAKLAFDGEGEFVSGSHCRWCKAKSVCRKRAEDNLKMAQFEFKTPDLLTDSELSEILSNADELSRWCKDIQAYVLERVQSGLELEGWELVEGRSTRKIEDDAKAVQRLLSEGYSEDQIHTKKLLGIGALEKLVGKKQFSNLLDDCIVKVQGEQKLKRKLEEF